MSTDKEPDFVDPDGPTSIRPRLTPKAIIVGCSPEVVGACKDILGDSTIGLEPCGVANYRSVAMRLWPPLIIIEDAVFAFDPEGFSEIAGALGSIIVRIENENMPRRELEVLLGAAVQRALPS